MSREELNALRRLAELEAKAGGSKTNYYQTPTNYFEKQGFENTDIDAGAYTSRQVGRNLKSVAQGLLSIPDAPAAIYEIPGALSRPSKPGAPFVENLGAAIQRNPLAPKLGQRAGNLIDDLTNNVLLPKDNTERGIDAVLQGAAAGAPFNPMAALSGAAGSGANEYALQQGASPDQAAILGLLAGGSPQALRQYGPRVVANTAQGVGKGAATLSKGVTARKLPALEDANNKLFDTGTNMYKAMKDNGAILKPETGSKVISEIETSLKAFGDIDPELHRRTLSVLRGLQDKIDTGDVSLESLDNSRKLFRQVIQDAKGDADGATANVVIKAIDRAVGGLGRGDLVKGDHRAVTALQAARKNWSQASKFEDMTDIIRSVDGNPNKLKTALNRYIEKNPDLHGFSLDEQVLLRDAAKSSTSEKLLRLAGRFGVDFGGDKNMGSFVLPAVAGIGTEVFRGGTGLPLVAAGTVAKLVQGAAGRGKLERVLQALEKNVSSPDLTPPVEPQLLLPSPRKQIAPPRNYVSDAAGAREMTLSEQVSANKARGRADQLGMSPDIYKNLARKRK